MDVSDWSLNYIFVFLYKEWGESEDIYNKLWGCVYFMNFYFVVDVGIRGKVYRLNWGVDDFENWIVVFIYWIWNKDIYDSDIIKRFWNSMLR